MPSGMAHISEPVRLVSDGVTKPGDDMQFRTPRNPGQSREVAETTVTTRYGDHECARYEG